MAPPTRSIYPIRWDHSPCLAALLQYAKMLGLQVSSKRLYSSRALSLHRNSVNNTQSHFNSQARLSAALHRRRMTLNGCAGSAYHAPLEAMAQYPLLCVRSMVEEG